MAKPSGSIKTLLENENIRKKVSCFIQEEVVLPQWSNDQNKHIYEKLFLEKQTFSLNKVSKPLDDEQQNNQNDPKNSYSNVCGFNVNIKTLLQNENIRKQVAPFIEKQIIIPVWSDGSDIEDSEINDITILPRNAKQLENQQPTQIKEEINVEDSTVISQGDVEKNQATDVMSFETNDGKSLCTNTDEKPNQEVNILPIKMEPQTSNVENQHPTIEQDLEYSNFASALKRIKIIKKRKKRFNALKNNPRKIGKLKIKRKKKRSIDNVRNHVSTSSYPPNEMKEIIEVTPMINLDDESSSTKNADVDENIQVTVIKEENTLPNSSTVDSVTFLEEKELDTSSGPVCIINDNADSDPMELEPIIKNETVDSLEGEECEIDYNVQRSFTDNENLIMESPVHDITNGNEECEQNFPSNSIHHKKLSNRRWVVRRRRAKFLRGCFKCGKKYKRFIMLRNHEIKCKVESQDYECAMCPYTTKDQSIFKQHLGNHILGNSNEMILGNVNSSQTDLKTKIKTEDNSGWGFIRLSRCPKCNWCNSDNNDNDKHVNDGDKLDRCSKCFTNLLVYQSTPTCAEYCKDEGYSACQDKIPYVRLTRLPFTCPDSVPLPSPPPLLRFPNSVLSNCEPPFSPPSTELLSKSNKVAESEQKSYSINQSSTTKLQSLVSESIIYQEDCSYAESDVELVKTEEFPTQLSVTDKTDECGDVAKVIENDIDNYRDNNFDVTNIDDLSCQKRRRTLKSSEWIQWFCQKCDAIQSSENFEVGWENQICKKCKAKLLYMCLKCDGKFSTYYTISYHLRYCCAQTEKKTRKRSNKSCSSNTLGSVHVQNHTNSKKVKCMSCDKVFSTQMYLNRHKSVCSKRKDDVQDTLSPNQNSPQTSHKGFIHVSCDRKIPVFTVNQETPTT